jgi:hypothetical protein
LIVVALLLMATSVTGVPEMGSVMSCAGLSMLMAAGLL